MGPSWGTLGASNGLVDPFNRLRLGGSKICIATKWSLSTIHGLCHKVSKPQPLLCVRTIQFVTVRKALL